MRLGEFPRILLSSLMVCFIGTPAALGDMVREGYIQDVQAERNEQFYEVFLTPPSVSTTAVDIRGKIFNAQLTSEFRGRYVQKFGYIDTDRLNFAADRFTNLSENRGNVKDVVQQNEDRRAYAEYVVKRLGEWHFDNYLKSDPSLRTVYEAKERLSNIQLQVTEETRARVNYAMADNSAELEFINPVIDSKVRVEMDPKSFGPSNVIENWIYLGKKISSKLYLLGAYATKDGLASVEFRKQHVATLSSSVKTTTTTTAEGRSPRQSFFGYALNYGF